MNTVLEYQKESEDQAFPLMMPLHQGSDPLCGGKAVGLAELIRLGFQVPEGLVLTQSAFLAFLAENPRVADLKGRFDTILTTDTPALQYASREILEAVMAARLPESVKQELEAHARPLVEEGTVIVRSSALGEDSESASFAGQLDSFGEVETWEALIVALKKCWASLWGERALYYQKLRDTPLAGMAVIIQRQIPAAVSGVLFTRAPDGRQHRADQMMAEYIFGPGELLVSGQENPGRLIFNRTDGKWHQEAKPEVPAINAALDPAGSESEPPWIGELCQAGLYLEDAFSKPLDIEWVVDDRKRLFFVQARPITVSIAGRGQPSRLVWSNANVNENYPDPISPLLYSVAAKAYTHYFTNLGLGFGIAPWRMTQVSRTLETIIGVHGARMYYNLSNIHTVIRCAPFGPSLSRYFDQFVGSDHVDLPANGTDGFRERGNTRFGQILELARVVRRSYGQFVRLPKRVRAFETLVDQFAEANNPKRLPEKSLAELHSAFLDFLDIRFHRWNNAALADTGAMVCYGLLKSLINRSFTQDHHRSLHNELLKALTGVVSSMPALKLWELSRLIRADDKLKTLFQQGDSGEILKRLRDNSAYEPFQFAFDDYLENWGFRFSGELMLTEPSFQENPSALVDLLRSYVPMEGESPEEKLNHQAVKRKALEKKVLKDLTGGLVPYLLWPRKRSVFKRLLRWTQRAITFRERVRLKQALLYTRLRRIVMEIGSRLVHQGVLGQSEDLFFLSYGEIDEYLSGRSMFPHHTKDLVALRKEAHVQLAASQPPDDLQLARGDYLPRDNSNSSPAEKMAPGQKSWQGNSACGGKVTARAAILASLNQANLLKPGDILVTRQTDPGWGPVFHLIKGLVIERGGMLSHGAIIAREFGIPAVVGIPGVTKLIPQGAEVHVDGDTGTVSLRA